MSEKGVECLKEMRFTNIILGDVTQLKSYFNPGDFDIIIAGEVIEHLGEPGAFLKSVRSIMSQRAEFVLTTIN